MYYHWVSLLQQLLELVEGEGSDLHPGFFEDDELGGEENGDAMAAWEDAARQLANWCKRFFLAAYINLDTQVGSRYALLRAVTSRYYSSQPVLRHGRALLADTGRWGSTASIARRP